MERTIKQNRNEIKHLKAVHRIIPAALKLQRNEIYIV